MSTHERPHTPQARPRRAVDSGPWPAPLATEPVHATVRVPGSKSETNRALVLAALSDGPSTIRGGLDARDTRLMRDGLRALGVRIDDDGPQWRVTPPAELTAGATIDCGLAGTVMRFLPPVAALAEGTTTFDGDDQAYARPMGPLLDALYDMGAGIPDDATGLPLTLTGRRDLPGGRIRIDASTSSQYVSGLLMVGALCGRGLDVEHVGGTLPSLPHIEMTAQMLRDRGVEIHEPSEHRWVLRPGTIAARDVTIEPDLTNAAVFLAAAAITEGQVTVPDWPRLTTQPGDLIREVLHAFGSDVRLDDHGLTVTGGRRLRGVDLDLADASELAPVVAALASVAHEPSRLRGIGHIRGHETDRLAALEAELRGLGSATDQTADGLVIHPRVLHGGDFATYADHRMAHAGALLGLIVDDITLDDIGCTSKTMPEFPALWAQMLLDSAAWSDAHGPGTVDQEGGR
ncbi:3-phosphoshikimate 1-carboxyvinyltransferase [Mariniluteicoccus endophyticus]